jgi:large subunit ribosomal protein L10
MTRDKKDQIIAELVDRFQSNQNFYFTSAAGMTVAQVNELRRLCFQRGVVYAVYKNTLIRKALEQMDSDYSPFNKEVLKGFTGIMFSGENAKVPAQLIKEFRKTAGGDKLVFKGASIAADLYMGADQLDTVNNLKSKAELIGEIIGLLQSPAKTVISQLSSGRNKLAGIVKTLSERGE